MIIRISGGNDGIAEYLENGRKAEREFTRDELDHRLILDGNLDVTNKIIQSIENTGQERYLHITLSFQESEISHEILKSITEEYKALIMNAFNQDEYSFYAEAHLPKIKNLTNNLTGELIERKPHIHIVIPETNLVTGNKLLPTGKVTMTERYLDAMQEHINYKYGLISPKDVSRVSDNNYASVLSRTKGDLFREKNSEIKKQILESLTINNITSFSQFGHYLQNFGEVKLRNSGKDNQYYAVKFDNDSKFTNLKSPLFSTKYIEKRELPIVKPTEKQVNALLNDWQQRVSHEVKHIYPKSEYVRKTYKSLSGHDKKLFLKERIDSYEQERKHSQQRGREERKQRGIKQPARPSLSRRANRLSYMPQRALVYGIRGSSRQSEREWQVSGREASQRLLSVDEHRHLGESRTESLYADKAVRRDYAGERPEYARGIKSIQDSSVLHDEFFHYLNQKANDSEIETMREVRNNIDPERFLSVLSRQFKIIASDYKISIAKDGSPRFLVGKRNMNASDFLTKHMNLSWIDSKSILLKAYSEQQAGIPYEKILTSKRLTKQQANDRFESLKETQKELKSILRLNRSYLYNEIKDLRNQIYTVRGHEREVARGLIVYHKLTGLENLLEIDKKGRDFITDYHAIWNEDKDPMKALQKLKEIINFNDEENGVEAAETTLSIKSRVEAQKRIQELQKTRLKDLVLQKSTDKLVFLNPDSEKPVFTDKGVRLIANKEASNEEIALMLEYAKEKFGGVLKLNGDEEFKTKCALIAAEKDMNIILKPEQFNVLMKEHKSDLISNHIVQDDQETKIIEQSIESVSDNLLKEAASDYAGHLNQRVSAAELVNKAEASPEYKAGLLAALDARGQELEGRGYTIDRATYAETEYTSISQWAAQHDPKIATLVNERNKVEGSPVPPVSTDAQSIHKQAAADYAGHLNQRVSAAELVNKAEASPEYKAGLLSALDARGQELEGRGYTIDRATYAETEYTSISQWAAQHDPKIAAHINEVSSNEISSYGVLDRLDGYNRELLLDAQDEHYGYLANVTEEGTTYDVLGHTEGNAEDTFVFASFNTETDAQEFSDIANSLGKTKLAELIDEHQATRALNVINEIFNSQYPEYSTEEDSHHATTQMISSLISEYAQKAESEGLEFFVRDVEQEITSKDMTLDEAKDYLEKEIVLMRTIKEDMQQDNENVQD
ncbi:LPD7 domain-containing protein [Phytobacter ursingii]